MANTRAPAYKIPGGAAILALTLLSGLFCRESDEETRLLLEAELKTERSDDALIKIQNLLSESNNEHSRVLSDTNRKNRSIGASPDGDTLYWQEGSVLFFQTPGSDDIRSIELPGKPDQLKVSFHGGYGLAVYREKGEGKNPPVCRLLPLSLRAARSLEESLLVTSCQSDPAITDQGVVYYSRDGALHNQQTVPEKAGSTVLKSASRDILPAKVFPLKYKKIKSRFYIFDIPGGGLLIFHGAAGFYRLYHYSGSGGQVKRLAESIARPRLYPVIHHLKLTPPPKPKPGENAAADAPPPQEPADQLRLREPKSPAFYVYAGAAGKYSLKRIDLGKTVRLGKAVKLRPLKDPIFIQSEKSFLLIRNGVACLWPPGKRIEYLPLETANLRAFQGGLAYEDQAGQLRLRKIPFTRHEHELLQLKFQAEKK